MATFTMTHELDCDTERFWKIFFDRDFNKKLFEHLAFPKWEIVEQREDDKEIVRIIKAVPKLEAPAPVAKVLGPGFGYTETGRFDRATKKFEFVIRPTALADKLKNEGKVRCEPLGDKRCKRIVDVVAEAKIFGIGGMIEKMTEKSFRDGWGGSATFINKWVKENP